METSGSRTLKMSHRKENKKEMRPQNGTASWHIHTETHRHHTTLYYTGIV